MKTNSSDTSNASAPGQGEPYQPGRPLRLASIYDCRPVREKPEPAHVPGGRREDIAPSGRPYARSDRFSSPRPPRTAPARPAVRFSRMPARVDDLARRVASVLTGPWRFAVLGAFALLLVVGLYGPVQGYYVAQRANGILNEQLKIQKSYNERLSDEVRAYASGAGIEDEAHKRGYLKPGEEPLHVEGIDQKGKGDEPDTSEELREALDAVGDKERPWYVEALDAFFHFDPKESAEVSSVGASSK